MRPPGPRRLKRLDIASIPPEASRDLAAERAQTVWASAQAPSTTLRTRRRWPDCISIRPIAHAASDRAGSERSRSKARGQPATTLQADARESFASGCYQSLGGRRTLPVSKSMPSQCSLSGPIKNNWRPSSTRTTEPDTAAIVPGVFSLSVAQSFIRDPIA